MRRLILLALLFAPAIASAHISLSSPPRRTTQLKQRHCGLTGSTRANVSTHAPGSQLTVTWVETINHPGHFRISFQPNGDVFGIPPCGNGVMPDAAGSCGTLAVPNFPTENQEGLTLPDGTIVIADFIPDGTSSRTVTLPDIECTNCTLQVIQVMTDKRPYTVDLASNDIYFQCADLILTSAPIPDAAPAGTPDADVQGTPDAADNPNTGTSGGCSTGGGSPGVAALFAVLGVAVWRRRARVRRP